MELKDTLSMMTNADYKERFKAEYFQVLIRYQKLKDMVDNWDNLKFIPHCSKEIFEEQLKAMKEYIDILRERAIIENVQLELNLSNELETVQKKEKLNIVTRSDNKGPGGAHHKYTIYKNRSILERQDKLTEIQFQCGARKEEGSISGVLDSDLLEIVRDRLKCFQDGPYASEYNECALANIEEALLWMNKRVENRIKRNVLRKEEK